jgi:hypothetical protein
VEKKLYSFVASQTKYKLNAWYFDFGALKHMNNTFDWFLEFVEDNSRSDSIILGDNKVHHVEGSGKVHIESGAKTFMFKNVLDIQGLKMNLLSVSEINQPRSTFGAHRYFLFL